MGTRLLDTSDELIILPFGAGITLISEKQFKKNKLDKLNPPDRKYFSVAELFKLPSSIFFLNSQNIIQNINETTIKTGGYESVKKTIGKTITVAAHQKTAQQSYDHNKIVLTHERLEIWEMNFIRRVDKVNFHAINFKYPWYSLDHKLIGVFGFSITMTTENVGHLVSGIGNLAQIGLLTPQNFSQNVQQRILPGMMVNHPTLSRREIECLRLLSQGKTVKLCAEELRLSPRTVEHYLENIKVKLNVRTRTQLIEKALEIFGQR